MTQLLKQAADENNENLGQWLLLITTIVVRPQQTLNTISEVFIPNWRSSRSEDLCQLKRLQPQRKMKHNSMRQTALNSSSNSCCYHICTCQSDQNEEEDKSDSKQLTKSNSKLDVLISKTNTRSIHSKCSFKVKLLKMEIPLRRTESYWQSTSKLWRERLLLKEDCWNFHAEKTECHNQQATQRLKEDNRKH